MDIGSKVKVVASRRSYNENGSVGVIVDETADSWLVDFGVKDGALMDYTSAELEEIDEHQTREIEPMTTTSISLLARDVGFDLRAMKTKIYRPAQIGAPSEIVEVVTDDKTYSGRACDIGSQMRRDGYVMAADWFAGRANWGQGQVIPPGHAKETALFAAVGAMAEEEAKQRGQ